MTTQTQRWQEITTIWKKEHWLYGLVGGLAGILIGIAVSGSLSSIMLWFANGFWNEALSIAITVIVLDRLNDLRAKEEHKLALFRQAKSRSNDFAMDALDQILHDDLWDALLDHYRIKDENGNERIDLSRVQWIGSVQLNFAQFANADLMSANLENTDLREANFMNADLRETNLMNANLRNAQFANANLRNAQFTNTDLREANLANADLRETNLASANLFQANLENTSLWEANLTNANLFQANLESANLRNANLNGIKHIERTHFNEKTVLPDAKNIGTLLRPKYDKYWTIETDMTRYTNPNHPDFWEPDWVKKART